MKSTSVSFHSLLLRLASRGSANAVNAVAGDVDNRPTSIRLEPQIKRFIRAQAEAFSTSEQAIINTILGGVVEMSTDQTNGTLRTIRERFLHVFQAHGLDLPSVAGMLSSHGITLSVLGDTSRLLDKISPRLINEVAALFHVRPEWLSGASDRVIDMGVSVRWYKDVPSIASRLLKWADEGLSPHVMFIRREHADFSKAYEKGDAWRSEPIGVIVRLHNELPDGIAFDTYECWEFERWNYWRCREQIKHLIVFCDEAVQLNRLSYSGYSVAEESIDALVNGSALPVLVVDQIRQVSWHPEDYAALRWEVEYEKGEWDSVKKSYLESKVSDLLKRAKFTMVSSSE